MTLLIDILPLAALVTLLAVGRTGPLGACGAAVLLSLPAAALQLGGAGLTRFALDSCIEGLWLAVVPVGIILGGLVFHAAVRSRASQAGPGTPAPAEDVLFTSAFLLGPFAETVTGFGVGAVFAISRIRAAGLAGPHAAAIALLTQTLIPWGGLGPGTAVGAALAGVPGQDIAARNALQLAPALMLLLALFWRWCGQAGVDVPPRRRAAQAGWVAAVAVLLVVLHRLVPWEVCGLLATGPVLAVKLLLARPPRGMAGWRQAAQGAAPYLLLAGVLLGSRLWPHPPALRPFPDLVALPLNHAMLALWLVVLMLLAGTRDPLILAAGALRRGWRAALALLAFVVLARFLGNAGIPQTLALALAGGFGSAAPYAAPLLAGASGFFTGTNVGANSAMMPLQAALGRVAGLDPVVLPAVQNGTLFLLLSPQVTAIASGLAGGGASPAKVWRLAWPVFVISIGVGMASVAIG